MSIWLIGDSTVASQSGWGDAFAGFSTASVINLGLSGSSSKSFREDTGSAWGNRFLRDAHAGDYVLIQFGHNDSKPEEYRHTEPGSSPLYLGTFRDYLQSYITDAVALGCIPILVTPVSRMIWTGSVLDRTHGEYPASMRKLSLDTGTGLLDLEETSYQAFSTLGQTVTTAQFSDGSDLTHFPAYGAWKVARMIVSLMRASGMQSSCKSCVPSDYLPKTYDASAYSVCK